MTEMTPAQTRVPSPELPGARALLERQTQPLYSCGALASATAVPSELLLFQYAQGQNIAGAGTSVVPATSYHTNMRVGGVLPKPKVFVYRGIRVVVPDIVPEAPSLAAAPGLTDPSYAGAVAANSDFLDSLKLIWGTGLLRFELSGLKPYLEVPLVRVPGNVGLKGVAALGGTGAANEYMRSEHFYTAGRKLRIFDEVLLASQQQFSVAIRWHQPTRVQAIDAMLIYVFIEGEHGREVM
jgi:hypothetical protein